MLEAFRNHEPLNRFKTQNAQNFMVSKCFKAPFCTETAPKLWSQELSRLVAEAAAGRSILAMDGAMGAMGAMAMAMAWQDWTKDRTIYKLY